MKQKSKTPLIVLWGVLVVIGPLHGQESHSLLERQLDLLELHGFSGSVLIRSRNRPEIVRGQGQANVEAGIPAAPETLYPIASLTKHFTAAAFFFLEQEGRLKTGDKLSRFWEGRLPHLSGVTFEQLLTHRSGLPADCGQAPASEEAFLDCLEKVELSGVPGAAYEYSNAGYALLAASLERITGESYKSFLRRHLLTPAGMSLSGFLDEPERWSDEQLARQYTWKQDHGSEVGNPLNWNFRGSADLVSNVRELGMWSDFLFGGFLDDPARERLFAQAAIGDGGGSGPDGGWCLDGAFTFGFSSRWCGSGNRDQVLVLSNHNYGLMTPAPIAAGLIQELLRTGEPFFSWQPELGAIANLDRWAGSYEFGRSSSLEVRLIDQTLEVSAAGQPAINWLLSRDMEQSQTMNRLTQQTSRFLKHIQSGNFERAAGIMGDPGAADALENWLQGIVSRSGALKGVSVIGTIPQGDGYRSYVELDLAGGKVLRRLRWTDDRIVSLLPANLPFAPVRFVPVGSDRLVGYHLAFPGRGAIELRVIEGKGKEEPMLELSERGQGEGRTQVRRLRKGKPPPPQP